LVEPLELVVGHLLADEGDALGAALGGVERAAAAGVTNVVRSTGAAVALCSVTTIIGYSSLLIAQNRALYLFGLLAVLGEICCLSTALVTLPAVLVVIRRLRLARRAVAM